MGEKQLGGRLKILLAVVGLAIAAAALLLVWRGLAPAPVAGEKRLAVEVVHGDGSVRSFEFTTGEAYLGRALVAEEIVVDDRADYGLYIQTADGETADTGAQEWWCVTKRGEAVNTGADSTPIADGDRFELTLTTGY